MKKQSILGEGHCGLTVTLNIADQYEITHLVERLEWYYEQRDLCKAWHEKRNAMKWEERKEWEEANPRPEDPMMPFEELEKAYFFLRKLTLAKSSKATVFSEIEEVEE